MSFTDDGYISNFHAPGRVPFGREAEYFQLRARYERQFITHSQGLWWYDGAPYLVSASCLQRVAIYYHAARYCIGLRSSDYDKQFQ